MKITAVKVCSIACLASLLLAAPASAAVIAWNAAAMNTDTSNAIQISTSGSLFLAVDINSNSIYAGTNFNVNGVIFTAANATPNVSIALSGSTNLAGNAPGTFTTYSGIVNAGAYNADASSPSQPIQLSNLLANHSYQLQLWTPYWNSNYPTRFSDVAPTTGSGYTHAANESPSVNVGNTGGGVTAQYMIGTFTADVGGLQSIYYYGDFGYGLIGAMQVRDLGLVPEPSTVALAGLGLSFVLLRLRRKQWS